MFRVDGWPHLYRHTNGTLYYVRRVPTDIANSVGGRQFKRSLKHRDERLAGAKSAYDLIHREVETYISKIRQGVGADDAQREYELAVVRAQRMGFDFRPMAELASEIDVNELVDRLIAVEKKIGDTSDPDVDAVLGAVSRPEITISAALERYVELNKNELRDKNPSQRQRWRTPLYLAVKNFTDLIGDKLLPEITRDDALKFREWWIDERIGRDVGTANTANKNLMALRKIFRVVNDTHRLGLENPFHGLSIGGGKAQTRVSLTREWIEKVILKGGALSGLNAEARGIILAMADTGARVNEITGLEVTDVVLDVPVPHIIIRPNSTRSLKTAHSERIIPLVGVALAAMKENPNGFPRYAGKNASASAVINKYLRGHKLLPDGATLYGLRHGFQDRLIEVEAPERIQADVMGHKTLRPKYGKGPSLSQTSDWLQRTALDPDR